MLFWVFFLVGWVSGSCVEERRKEEEQAGDENGAQMEGLDSNLLPSWRGKAAMGPSHHSPVANLCRAPSSESFPY